ncbi:AcrR family transcriptional regulator [Saccharothrix tamanrassetensis]|uniref:AcrR family transcriptional regulator n=1 Tax=Saccharothrix tamanrassetensis TaxID=1051531 RepID=A0A841C9Z9_9PSEU|nr:TetR/AcrR family transcriptional regulator [Saccharothrix tamanrassetensis]MBB5953790.1 AcrR family transcriptional regulator [Saccharothrix tamanrassetensis]
MSSPTEAAGLSGRRRQAALNDEAILNSAREVFLADPKSPISDVAKHAGVGISALYRRYPGKEALLRQLCHDGLRRYLAEAEAALADPDGWTAFTGFLTRVVDADVHSLTVHLAGTFTPTPEMGADAERAGRLAEDLVERARATGKLRGDIVLQDIALVLESCAAIRVPDRRRTTELRRRVLAMLIDSISRTGAPDLPGPPPEAGEFNWRWQRRP